MIGQVRAAHPSISMGGEDFFSKLAPYFISLSYTDNCDGKKADDLSIELSDRDMKFISTWAPQKGATLDVGIITERWFTPIGSDLSLDCGTFWIDSVEFELPDQKVHIKANSIPTNVRLKSANESRGWDDANLKDIADQIAGENKMSVDFQAENNPRYTRTEQHDESALGFLMKRCANAKLAIKVHRNKIVIFDEEKLESEAPKFAIVYGNVPGTGFGSFYRMAGGTFTSTIADTAKKAKVKHTVVESGETSEGEAESTEEDDDAADSDVDHNVNEDTDEEQEDGGNGGNGGGNGSREVPVSEGSASQWNASDSVKAKAVLRDKNKHKFTGKIALSLGNPLIAAGQTFTLKGVGQYDGTWFIESAHHEVGPEYNTELTVRKCLTGY
jgi:phage protein D